MYGTTYRVRYLSVTESRGARFSVEDLMSGQTKVVAYDYASITPRRDSIGQAFGHVADAKTILTGQVGDDYYYTVVEGIL